MSSTARCVGSFAAMSASVWKPGLLPRTFTFVWPNEACFEIENFMMPDPSSAMSFALSSKGSSCVN